MGDPSVLVSVPIKCFVYNFILLEPAPQGRGRRRPNIIAVLEGARGAEPGLQTGFPRGNGLVLHDFLSLRQHNPTLNVLRLFDQHP